MSVLYIDTETTGLDPRVHVPWEVAIIEPDGTEHVWCWRPGLDWVVSADSYALEVGGFHQRAPVSADFEAQSVAAEAVAALTEGNVLIGSKPSFDMDMLTPWLRFWGFEPGWHHRPVCVTAVAFGWIQGQLQAVEDFSPMLGEVALFGTKAWGLAEGEAIEVPWSSDVLSRACGVEPPAGDERHTALGDARWVKRWYETLTGGAA